MTHTPRHAPTAPVRTLALPSRRVTISWLGILPMVLVLALLASTAAEARAIRVDSGGDWTDPDTTSANNVPLGFTFDFFGVSTTTVDINADGSVSFGGATISPFVGGQNTGFESSQTISPIFNPSGILAGFRVCWNCLDPELEFQLAIFALSSGQFAMEFNYGALPSNLLNPTIGYDNGQGTTFSLFSALGLDPGNPAEWAGNCPNGPPGTDLACNNYDFNADSAQLPGGFDDYFRLNPSLGNPAFGRYFFLLGEAVDVPAPPTVSLLLAGLLAFGVARRRSR